MKIVLECKNPNCHDRFHIENNTSVLEVRRWLRIHDIKRVIRFEPDDYDTLELSI